MDDQGANFEGDVIETMGSEVTYRENTMAKVIRFDLRIGIRSVFSSIVCIVFPFVFLGLSKLRGYK
jgi:hypothetical protein